MVNKTRSFLVVILLFFVASTCQQMHAMFYKSLYDSAKKNKTNIIVGVAVCSTVYFLYASYNENTSLIDQNNNVSYIQEHIEQPQEKIRSCLKRSGSARGSKKSISWKSANDIYTFSPSFPPSSRLIGK